MDLRRAFARYPFRRLGAWFFDVMIVSFICAFAFGDVILAADPARSFLVAVASAIVGFAYFAIFAMSTSSTPGLMLMRGTLSASKRSSLIGAGLFGAMLLPLGVVLLALEPAYDVLGAFGVEVRV